MHENSWSAWEAQFGAFLDRGAVADAAHDREHIRRVVRNATMIAQAEHADLNVVIPAAWLHDCVVVPKDSPQRSQASRLAAQAATTFLAEVNYPPAYLPAIAHAIAAHSFSARIWPETLEARVVQDADRLDALGALGIARTMMLGGAMRKPLYDPTEPLPRIRPPDDTRYVIDHFFQKLLLLSAGMTTATGRREAEQRTTCMRQYLAQLAAELGLEPPAFE